MNPEAAPPIWPGTRTGLIVALVGIRRRGAETELVIGFGTPGVGRGALAVSELPTSALPTVEVTFPPRRPGDQAPVVRVALSADD